MTDKNERHSVVQSMFDVVEEVFDPVAAALKKAQRDQESHETIENNIKLSPEMSVMIQLLQMGINPKDLGMDMDDK